MFNVAEIAQRLRANGQWYNGSYEIKLFTSGYQWRLTAKSMSSDWSEMIEFRPYSNTFAIKIQQICESIMREMKRIDYVEMLEAMKKEHLRSTSRVEKLLRETDIDVTDYVNNTMSVEDMEKCIEWIRQNTVELRLSTSSTSTGTTGTPDTT